jgi:tetratricopeptide (TPR) repeat protein
VLNTPKDNFNLAGIYYNMQQFDYVAEILGNGLQNGGIESTQANYELLASAYQQARKELKAIEALREAARKFPKAGSIDVQISQIYYSIDKYEDAYRYMESGLKKGVDKNASQSYAFLAYLGLELKKYDEALAAAEKAVELDPNSREAKRLLEATQEAVKDREAFRNAPNRR